MLRLHTQSTGVTCVVMIVSLMMMVVSRPAATHAQTAYFSLEGDIVAAGDEINFGIDLTRSVGSSENLLFLTYTYAGGTNYAGDTITASSFDSDLHFYDGLSVLHGQDDQSGPGFDALLSWTVGDTPLNPDPLLAGHYRLNLQEYMNNNTGPWAVDMVGPADAMTFTGATGIFSSTIDSLKFGTTGGGTAMYNHGSTVNLLGDLVVAATGNAELNVDAGTLTVGGQTTINSGGTIEIDGGTLSAVGPVLVDGGTFTYNSGYFYLASSGTFSAVNDATVDFSGSLNINSNKTYRVRSGSDITFGGYVDVGGNSDGVLIVEGAGTTYENGNSSCFWGYGGGTAQVFITTDAQANIDGLNLRIGYGTTVNSTGLVSIESGASMTVSSNIYLASDGTAGGMGTINVMGADSTFEQTGYRNLTIGHASDGVGRLSVEYSGSFTSGSGTITVNPTGLIEVNSGGSFLANGDIVVDGGTIDVTNSSFALATGKTLTASNNGQVHLSNSYNIANGNTFTFDSGADLTGDSYIDVGTGADGTLIIDGPGSTISTNDVSYYGSNGATGHVTLRNEATAYYNNAIRVTQGLNPGTNGVLNVESGADAYMYGTLAICTGGTPGGSGTVTVTGAGSTIVQSGDVELIVGHATDGTGLLTITDNGSLTTGTDSTVIRTTGTIDISNGGKLYTNGNILVDGGTLNRNTGGLLIMDAGTTLYAYNNGQVNITGSHHIMDDCTFEINSGADLASTSYIDIGNGSNGTLIVDGVGSTLTVNGQSYWGSNGGTATVTLSNNAYVELVKLQLAQGSTAGTTGSLRIESGADAFIQGEISLAVGAPSGGSATLHISGPGSTLTQTMDYDLDIGSTTSGSASVTIDNSGSYTQDTGSIFIHDTGTVNISNGGSFSTGGTVDLRGGTLNLDDGEITTGSFIQSSGTFNFNDGKLTIDGGTFDPGTTYYRIYGPTVSELPTLVFDNGASAPVITGSMHVGHINRGAMQILNGSTLSSTTAYIGYDSTSKGSVIVDGSGSTWNITDTDLRVGQSGYGELIVSDHAVINVADDFGVGCAMGGTGYLHLTSRATINVATRTVISDFGDGEATIDGGATLTSQGGVWISNLVGTSGTLHVRETGTLLDAKTDIHVGGNPSGAKGIGIVELSDNARISVGAKIHIWDQGSVNFSGGTLSADIISDIDGGTFKFTGGVLHVNTYEGHLINNGGTVAPGHSVGLTSVTKDYSQFGGVLEVELANTPGAGGIDYDLLDVIGDLELAGTLDILLTGGFMPATGDSFDVISFHNSRYGVFDQVLLPKTPGVGLDLVYMSKSVRIVTRLAGDLNGDGFVGLDDLDIVLTHWNQNVDADVWRVGDVTGDGYVGLDDLDVVLNNWNAGTPPTIDTRATIPEPSTGLMLLGIIIAGSLMRK